MLLSVINNEGVRRLKQCGILKSDCVIYISHIKFQEKSSQWQAVQRLTWTFFLKFFFSVDMYKSQLFEKSSANWEPTHTLSCLTLKLNCYLNEIKKMSSNKSLLEEWWLTLWVSSKDKLLLIKMWESLKWEHVERNFWFVDLYLNMFRLDFFCSCLVLEQESDVWMLWTVTDLGM